MRISVKHKKYIKLSKILEKGLFSWKNFVFKKMQRICRKK